MINEINCLISFIKNISVKEKLFVIQWYPNIGNHITRMLCWLHEMNVWMKFFKIFYYQLFYVTESYVSLFHVMTHSTWSYIVLSNRKNVLVNKMLQFISSDTWIRYQVKVREITLGAATKFCENEMKRGSP